MTNPPAKPPRSLSTEVLTDAMADVILRKTGAQRREIVDFLYQADWALIEGNVRATQPDWDDRQVTAKAARRIAGGA